MKNLRNLGKALTPAEQKTINGGCIGCGPGPFDPIDDGGTGGGTGGGSSCGGLTVNCSPGKCFNPSTCRCQYGEGAGAGMNGVCL
ncbi:hypothetical protein N7U66_09345 [Lacinutrix neustonica]|uniref:Uncharacterized protein n=1 Tax=Lacinutrix neustonica TaxID=2980107 RepID=A0A9E8MXQ9_9FLAO|nr:hypothetical protein [Lacinutrix neustonica]WAC03637.1 hypothetical protein N7U66_09345 [Lacinutrix neustonica]